MIKFKISILLVLLSINLFAQAQEFMNNEEYIAKFATSADSLLKVNKSVSAQEAKNVAALVGDKVKITLKGVKSKLLTPNQVFGQSKKATVIVGSAYLCTHCEHTHINPATGYIIDENGIVVTNYHVVNAYAYMGGGNKPLAFLVRLYDGRTYPVKDIIAASEKDDLAILRLDTQGDKLPAFALAPKANIGDVAYSLGHPHNLYYYFSQGHVNHKYVDKTRVNGTDYYRNIMLISAEYGIGSSGGPIIDAFGRVIGTVSSTRTLSHAESPTSVQMILKKTIPVESLWKLLK
ncbi:serine protease [Sphingobacterium sp. DR205]|uniref:S1 family peptidase n=1 Tax=Sphingobacterium sp. DR205 TaxID=2713573 RepID=UPI0013E42E8E|nr:serine protease [Sphingobacterium sp. DR205]QIH35940.1 trypsin-like peptidase domain-containing protein [Sphingobacterium sp. DR205]